MIHFASHATNFKLSPAYFKYHLAPNYFLTRAMKLPQAVLLDAPDQSNPYHDNNIIIIADLHRHSVHISIALKF